MTPHKLPAGEKIEVLEANSKRRSFSVRVLKAGAEVEFEFGQQRYTVPGNEGVYQIECAIPWRGPIMATSGKEVDIEVFETEDAS